MVKFPCHRKAERCISIGTLRSPICARCSGIVVGLAFGCFVPIVSPTSAELCLIPALVDGTGQMAGRWQSNNWLRLGMGLLAGIGLGCLVFVGFRESISAGLKILGNWSRSGIIPLP